MLSVVEARGASKGGTVVLPLMWARGVYSPPPTIQPGPDSPGRATYRARAGGVRKPAETRQGLPGLLRALERFPGLVEASLKLAEIYLRCNDPH